ncbi:hypothetical protein OG21DRAFT_1502571 [Imleria badia]|nr:hypothetical protein OG21DRAFT_1502571 [Imleria badia]
MATPRDIAASANGRLSGKSWKLPKTATVYDRALLRLSSCVDQTVQSLPVLCRTQVDMACAHAENQP